MWEVTDIVESSGTRGSRSRHTDAQVVLAVVTCLTSRFFPWDFVSAEPGRLVLRRNAYLREFRRVP